jgi:hypothetical protein
MSESKLILDNWNIYLNQLKEREINKTNEELTDKIYDKLSITLSETAAINEKTNETKTGKIRALTNYLLITGALLFTIIVYIKIITMLGVYNNG